MYVMRILLKNALIIKMDDTPIFYGDILVNGNRIEKITESIETEEFDKFIDCKGNILLPGFKNAHAHTAMTFLRGGGKELSLQDWLFTYCFPREERLTGSDVYYCAKVGFCEYIQAGITTAFDQYLFPLETARAAEEIGFRVVLVCCYESTTTENDLISEYKMFNSKDEPLVTYQIGIHAEYTLDERHLNVINNIIKDLKVPFYTHISETQKEVDECYKRHGVSPVKYFDDLGMFDYGGGGYHCNFFNEEDVEIFKNKNVSIITNPGSNKYLNSGVCPVQKYYDLGFKVAIGTDGPASNYDLDMFQEMKLIHKNNPNIPAYEILKMATTYGAWAMKIPDCDSLQEGKLADIIMVDKSVILDNDANSLNAFIENGDKHSVKMTMINGQVLYFEGGFVIKQRLIDIYRKCKEVTERINKEMEEC